MSICKIGHPRKWRALTAFLVTNVCAVIVWVYFFVLNRVQVVRPYHGDYRPNLIFVCNHQAPLDSFLVGLAAFFPRALFHSRLHPWNFAASQHFFHNRAITWLSSHLRCIAVTGGGDAGALRTMCRVLPSGVTVLFPEGRRSPNGIIGPGLPGAGFLVCQTGARIVPVAIDGLLAAMPYHAPRPHTGKRISIAFGEPVSYDDLLTSGTTHEIAQAIVDRSMAAVNRLHQELRLRTSASVVRHPEDLPGFLVHQSADFE
jgi:1-acyl-sn-glycerol-3-phosphate acyltransferase